MEIDEIRRIFKIKYGYDNVNWDEDEVCFTVNVWGEDYDVVVLPDDNGFVILWFDNVVLNELVDVILDFRMQTGMVVEFNSIEYDDGVYGCVYVTVFKKI